MKDVVRMVRRHFDGIARLDPTRQTNGFIEALNGLFQAANAKPAATPALPPCEPCSS
jgi:hypothetical protein